VSEYLFGRPAEMPPSPDPRVATDGVAQRPPSAPPSPSRRTVLRVPKDLPKGWSAGVISGHESDRVFGVRAVADELFQAGTDPYDGRTHKNRYLLSVGIAGALLAELALLDYSPADGLTPQRPLLDVHGLGPDQRPTLVPNARALDEAPPRDPLQYEILHHLSREAAQDRQVDRYIEYLADDAYMRVGRRLTIAGVMEESETRRGWLRPGTRTVWTTVQDATKSTQEMLRIPRMLRDHEPLSCADRVLLGLFDAVDLHGPIRREFGDAFDARPDLRLPEHLRALVSITKSVVALKTRTHHR
jgi:hypothetical protein